MAVLGANSGDDDFILFARKELVEWNNIQLKFMDEYERAKVFMIYGYAAMNKF